MGFFDLFRGDRSPLVVQAFEDMKVMVSNDADMFAAAAAHLLDNEILDVDLEELDREINRRERHLRSAVHEHLRRDPDHELVFCLKLLSIVTEAERIGDLSKSLVEVAHLADGPRMGPLQTPLRRARDQVLTMFDQVQVAFFEDEEDVARTHLKQHTRLKQHIRTYLVDLAGRNDLTPNDAFVCALSARMMSRVSSHLANIASAVVMPFDEIRSAPVWAREDVVN